MAYTTIDDPSEYFGTVLYTGNVTVRALTFSGNSDLDVDWIWLKSRSGSGNHHVYDTVRGTQKHLRTNLASAEGTNGGTDGVTAFSSNGVTIGTNTASNDDGETFVGWGWKAGTSFTNDASSTSVGTIDSAGSVSTDAGFSITSFTANGSNATIAHGLGAVPQWVILKNRSISKFWATYHASLGEGKAIFLDTTAAADADNTYWNNTAPTSTTFSFGTNSGNNDGNNMIAYCFAEKQGYSKFGSYTGNGNADGPMTFTGFKPAFIIVKRTDSSSAGNWQLVDNKRSPFNVAVNTLSPDAPDQEYTSETDIDMLSNGFKIRENAQINVSGSPYIYMAFAENPFVTSTGVPATAR